jgi:hypothetical protein
VYCAKPDRSSINGSTVQLYSAAYGKIAQRADRFQGRHSRQPSASQSVEHEGGEVGRGLGPHTAPTQQKALNITAAAGTARGAGCGAGKYHAIKARGCHERDKLALVWRPCGRATLQTMGWTFG